MAGGSDKYVDNPSERLLHLDQFLHQLLPIVVLVLFAYLGLYFFTGVDHVLLDVLEYGIILYFVAEVGVAYLLYEDTGEFLRDKWLNILLLVPILATARAVGRVGQALYGIEAMSVASIAETPVLGRAAPHLPKLRKLGHGIVDSKKALLYARKYKLSRKAIFGKLALVSTLRLFRRESKHDRDGRDRSG